MFQICPTKKLKVKGDSKIRKSGGGGENRLVIPCRMKLPIGISVERTFL